MTDKQLRGNYVEEGLIKAGDIIDDRMAQRARRRLIRPLTVVKVRNCKELLSGITERANRLFPSCHTGRLLLRALFREPRVRPGLPALKADFDGKRPGAPGVPEKGLNHLYNLSHSGASVNPWFWFYAQL